METQKLEDFFIQHIHSIIPSWFELQADDLIVENTIGITNKTYIIKQKQYPVVQPEKIIFRHYGEHCEASFLNRNREIQIVQKLSEISVGPQQYGYTSRVRLEEYLYSRVLKQSEMKNRYYSTKVAIKLAEFHQIDMNVELIDKIPLPLKFLHQNSQIMKAINTKLQNLSMFSADDIKIIDKLKEWFSIQELEFVKLNLPQRSNNICFSHNDLLANNILVGDQDDKITFIDYEYCSYNYNTFDIANYFAESLFDYTFPTEPYFKKDSEDQLDQKIIEEFIQTYLLTKLGKLSSDQPFSLEDQKNLIGNFNHEEYQLLEEQKKELISDMNISFMLSHLYWGLWGFYMSKSSDICFDYLQFTYERYKSYHFHKKLFLEQLML